MNPYILYLLCCVIYLFLNWFLQDDLDLFFTDPQQLLDLVTELTQQNLSLFNISTMVEKTLKELQQTIETTKNNM